MNVEKIITNNRHLSLKAMGLIAFIKSVHFNLKYINKSILQKELHIGKDALCAAFKELTDANIIEVTKSNRGKFVYEYKINKIYL